ncbi:MAG: 2-oxoglutarate oxidoreductase subunit KorA [Firmicutes bacterium ADurb.Bin193]|nr:MAG: 2-oxoglutarate oxidoreductase subunit KorA [Firmicutes bacterium ADurb.Bin193]
MDKVLMKGNEAIAEAAIRAGCRHFFGYPITPQTEISAYMARRMPKIGGTFLQAESEVAAINMVYGAAGAGVRAMTSSSSPGISLKSEGISYIAGADLPCVIVNIVRAGPGLGGIQPAQSDYFQAVKGGGHGDYRMIVVAPSSIQEIVDSTFLAFDLADKYRMPVMLMGDGMLGQMMEPVAFPDTTGVKLPEKEWATTGTKKMRKPNIINSLYIQPDELEALIKNRWKKYIEIEQNEVRFEAEGTEDAEIILVAYGATARIVKAAIKKARENGIKAGLIRPITLWPFPSDVISAAAKKVKAILCVEMSMGQMVEDVRLSAAGACPVHFYGRTGGVVPIPADVYDEIRRYV